MSTLVSAFIDRSRYDPKTPKRPLSFYLDHGRALLALDVPKIVFLEPHVISLLSDAIAHAPQTMIVPFAKEDMDYWPERTQFLECPVPPTSSPDKDTPDYFIIQLNKAGWCDRAAELNPFHTRVFMWMDFGINYLLKQASLSDHVARLDPAHVRAGTIRIPGCAYFACPVYPTQLVWKYCGSMFAGDAEAVARMRADQRDVMTSLLTHRLITWEVTVWFHMNALYFDRYIADHNDSMLTDF